MRLERNRELLIGGSEGRDLELRLFGGLRADDPEYVKMFMELVDDKKTGYMSYPKALKLLKEFQPAPPADPKRPFASRLLDSTRKILGFDDKENRRRIRFYTSVAPARMEAKTAPLDFWHGVDALIEIEVVGQKPSDEPMRVTLDVTGKDKKENPKADIVIYEKDLDDKKMDDAAREVAEKVAATLNLKLKLKK